MKRLIYCIAMSIIIVLLITSITMLFAPKQEIERYSIAMEITHCEKTAIYKKRYGTEIHYTFSLRGDDKVITIDVSPQIYAQYKEGEWLEVEFIEYEYAIFHCTEQEINILGYGL